MTLQPSPLGRIFAELVTASRRTGTAHTQPLRNGAEMVVTALGPALTATFKRPGKLPGMTDEETFRRQCGRAFDAELREPPSIGLRLVEGVPWYFVTLSWNQE